MNSVTIIPIGKPQGVSHAHQPQRYEYTVGGRKYLSDRVVFTGGYKTPFRHEAEKLVGVYEQGSMVKVHYAPSPNCTIK